MMKTLLNNMLAILIIGLLILPCTDGFAGNEDRSGEAGASELLINPWARGSGWGSVNVASVHGLEAMFTNIAGLAFTKKTEIIFAHTQYMQGTDISINAFGFSQKVGETGVIGMGIMSMSFGDIPITTVNQPEGGLGTFSPNLLNIGISYSKAFSKSIYGGINMKIVSESISDATAQGIALDAGIQYVTGAADNVKFGISLKNVGSKMKFNGDGLSFRGFIPGNDNTFTVEQRSNAFELPSLLNIGFAYDFYFGEKHRLTAAFNFTSNSFIKDQYTIGAEYGFMEYLMLRAGYTYQEGAFSDDVYESGTIYAGPSAGFSVEIPMNRESGSTFSVDYSYRHTNQFEGTHSLGARINL